MVDMSSHTPGSVIFTVDKKFPKCWISAILFSNDSKRYYCKYGDLPHCPQVLWHLSFICVLVLQYFANSSHFVDMSSHTAGVGASTVVDVASVSGVAEKPVN